MPLLGTKGSKGKDRLVVKVSCFMFGVPNMQSVSRFALVASDPISKEVGVNLVVLLCFLCCGGAFRSFQESLAARSDGTGKTDRNGMKASILRQRGFV